MFSCTSSDLVCVFSPFTCIGLWRLRWPGPPQHVAAGITDHGENEMGTKPARLGPDRVCLCRVCGGDEEQQPAFLWLPCCLLWEHDYMCHSLDGLSAVSGGQNETTVLCQVVYVSKAILILYLRAVIPLIFQVEQFKTELPLYTMKQTLAMCSMSNIINYFILIITRKKSSPSIQ